MRYHHHIFICTNHRDPEDTRGSCGAKGSDEIRSRFKELVHANKLKASIRANACGCLDACEFGPVAVVYPEGVWYGGITIDDIDEIVQSHLIGGKPVNRLRIRHRKYTPAQLLASGDEDAERSDEVGGAEQ